MTIRRRNWIIAAGVFAAVLVAGVWIAASIIMARIEPYARQTAVRYLSQRFNSDVELRALRLRLPKVSLLHLILTLGHGAVARIEGDGLTMRSKDRPGAPPLFSIHTFSGEVSLDSLLHPPVQVSVVTIDGMEIRIPPRGERPSLGSSPHASNTDKEQDKDKDKKDAKSPSVSFARIQIKNAALVMQPKDPTRTPLRFEIANLLLQSVRPGAPMKYDVSLRNAKPPGHIHATGTFGPWSTEDPGDSPVTGDYTFDNADLGVFNGIAGILHSTGHFEGQLEALKVNGEASVPDFRLKRSGNPVPLMTHFNALVDGTNGNTILQPVQATLGSTHFTTSGGIIKHQQHQPRVISLDVNMPDGNMHDILRLAMKGSPFMEGRLTLKTKLDIPPLSKKVRDKLILDGTFTVLDGKFVHSTIQDHLDSFSKRARGQADDPGTPSAVSHMSGEFHLENAALHFKRVSFGVPGANLNLHGDYNLDTDALNFDGALRLQATVSELVTGWKSFALKAVDRLFEKRGAGTYLEIQIDGTSKDPNFGVVIAGKKIDVPIHKN
jgi:hypothetical protein